MSKAQFLAVGKKKQSDTWTWETSLKYFAEKMKEDNNISLSKYIIPVNSFNEHVLREHLYHIKEGIIVEVEDFTDEYVENKKQHSAWFARVIKIGGYRLLCRWIGAEPKTDSTGKSDFWISLGSKSLHSVGYFEPLNKEDYFYRPPRFIVQKWKDNILKYIEKEVAVLSSCCTLGKEFQDEKAKLYYNKFRKNQRVELLSTLNFVRPARISATKGRRVRISVREDEATSPKNPDDEDYQDLQYGADADYWLDQDSFMIFHVGWASLNNFKLVAKEAYASHAKRVADALRNGELPAYHPDDATVQDIRKWQKNGNVEFEKGMKLELFDPFDTSFKNMHAATIVKVLKDGYLIVRGDDEDEAETVPLHCTSNYLYPIGHASKYKLPLLDPNENDTTMNFDWDSYLRKTKGAAAPECLFPEFNPEDVQKKFKKGARLEAADQNELNLICPALIASVHGRVLRVHFIGWEDSYDQLFDFRSNDIYPLGFCEIHGYELQKPSYENLDPPEVTEENLEGKRKKKR